MSPEPENVKIAGLTVHVDFILMALVAAVVGAVVLPFLKLNMVFPNQSKWVYGGIWFVIGIVVIGAAYMKGSTGYVRSLLVGAGMAFFIAAFLQWAGWTFTK